MSQPRHIPFYPGAKDCPLCAPRPEENEEWKIVQKLEVSTLYLERNQVYRGYCILIFDPDHVHSMEELAVGEYQAFSRDLGRAARAISVTVDPDHMNYASLGNVVPHLHWHLIPRYKDDPRWGAPIWTTNAEEMSRATLDEAEFEELIGAIRENLQG